MKVLVVDDEQTNRVILKAMLAKDAHEVILAADGKEAIDCFEAEQPDLILLDVMMPVMDGYTAARIIKEKSTQRFIPIIFLTAMTDEAALVKCIDCGGDDFLTKPYSRPILQAKIHALDRIRELYDTISAQNAELEDFHERSITEQEVSETIFSRLMRQGELDLPMIRYIRSAASTLNGDILLASRQPSGVIYLLVGDFTGHGLAAAIGALPAAQIFYAMCAKGFSLDDIVQEINLRLKAFMPANMFLAATLIQIDPKNCSMGVWNGGLPEVMVYGPDHRVIHRVESSHLPLGVLSNDKLESGPVWLPLLPDSRIYAYTDGVIESDGFAGQMFGQERLEKILRDAITENTNAIAQLEVALQAFRGEVPPRDDTTLLEFHCSKEYLEAAAQHEVDEDTSLRREWNFEICLEASSLRDSEPVGLVMTMLRQLHLIGPYKEELHLILSELFNNAMDYGVLRLDADIKSADSGFLNYYVKREERLLQMREGFVRFKLRNHCEGETCALSISLEDSGAGFDFERVMNREVDLHGLHGRGVALVRSLCKSVTFTPPGNRVEVVYAW